ncbi:MAG: nicotinate-nucleotide--dimethylbenzimidazole phosphoribosyltransferase [Chloroflexota bacterium]
MPGSQVISTSRLEGENELHDLILGIGPLDHAAMRAARGRQDALTKPRGSLGRLEQLSIQLAGITGDARPHMHEKLVVVIAGDHGIVEEGVSAYPQQVTAQMVMNFLRGGAAISVLARQAGARLRTVDMGIAGDIPPDPGLQICKIGRGTRNFAKGPAMSRDQALQSIMTGAVIAEEEIGRGVDLFAAGDMGIGNTTPAAAIAAVLTGRSAEELAGRGTGIDDDGLQRKVSAIRRGLDVNRPDARDGLDILGKVGGFEIGGLAGMILGAAAHRKPVVIDGYISTAAAMIAVRLAPAARDYLIAAHVSAEGGHRLMLAWLDLEPLLDLSMRLGEGTGAVLAMNLVEAACRVLAEMATFDEAGVSAKSG